MTDQNWQISKNIPLTLIFMMVVQLAVFVYSWSAMNSNINKNIEQIKTNKDMMINNNTALTMRLGDLENDFQSQAIDMAQVVTNIQHIRDTLERLVEQNSHR